MGIVEWFGDKVLAKVGYDIDQRLQAGGMIWLQESRSLAPEDSGFLKAAEGFSVANHTLTLIMGASYDIFQEFGTRNIPPRPHVRPALNAISIPWGGTAVMDFNRMGSSVWGGLYAHQAGFVMPGANRFRQRATLTFRQRQHVEQHLIPVSRQHYRGNVRRAKMRVRRFGRP